MPRVSSERREYIPCVFLNKNTVISDSALAIYDLSKLLEYTEYGKFSNTLNKAKKSCKNPGYEVDDHFAHVSDMVKIGSNAERKGFNLLFP